MKRSLAGPLLALLLVSLACVPARGHFLWLAETRDDDGSRTLQVYFGEQAAPDDPDLLQRVADVQPFRIHPPAKRPAPVKLRLTDGSLAAALGPDAPADAVYVLSHDYGIITRGDSTFVLKYYAKTGPPLGPVWDDVPAGKTLALDIQPSRAGDDVRLTILFEGKPQPGAQVVAIGPAGKTQELESDAKGRVMLAADRDGVYSIRARHIETNKGQLQDQAFDSVRHYATLALPVFPGADAASTFPALPELVTSFGAAVTDNGLYVYGGHMGRAHEYYTEAQARTLRRLDFKTRRWESLGKGPGLQGLAMVAHDSKLYRIGGFTAKNADGKEEDLWSQAGVACYDIKEKQWSDMPPLPEPRSSFDAAVLGDKIYVVGGWTMAGDAERQWLKTAYALDLARETPQWSPLPQPPFQRRALAVAAHQGQIFAIGGMRSSGSPTRRVDIFDPKSGQWRRGPDLQGEKLDGFGASAFATGGRLYASTYSGKLQRLAEDGKSWEVVRQLERDRFFHRMLPFSSEQLITVGGASMQSGKFKAVEVLDIADE